MATYTFIGAVRLPGGGRQDVEVQAGGALQARKLLEMQYGKSNVIGIRPK